jgi:hypothetical protein
MAPKGPRHACPLPPTGIGAAQDVNELVGRMSVRDFNPRTLSVHMTRLLSYVFAPAYPGAELPPQLPPNALARSRIRQYGGRPAHSRSLNKIKRNDTGKDKSAGSNEDFKTAALNHSATLRPSPS